MLQGARHAIARTIVGVRDSSQPQRHSMPVALATSAWNLLGVPWDDCGRTRRIQGARHAIARAIGRCAIHPPSPSVIPCRLPWQPQRGISLACHRMIARAHAADSGCEAMLQGARPCHRTYDYSVRHASHVQPAWNLLGSPSDDCSSARGGFRVRGMPSHVRFGGARIPRPQRHSMSVAWGI